MNRFGEIVVFLASFLNKRQPQLQTARDQWLWPVVGSHFPAWRASPACFASPALAWLKYAGSPTSTSPHTAYMIIDVRYKNTCINNNTWITDDFSTIVSPTMRQRLQLVACLQAANIPLTWAKSGYCGEPKIVGGYRCPSQH